MQVTVEMPDQVARQWEKPDTVGRHVMETRRLKGTRRPSRTQVADAGLDYWQTKPSELKRAVPLNLFATDLAADNATLEKILSLVASSLALRCTTICAGRKHPAQPVPPVDSADIFRELPTDEHGARAPVGSLVADWVAVQTPRR